MGVVDGHNSPTLFYFIYQIKMEKGTCTWLEIKIFGCISHENKQVFVFFPINDDFWIDTYM
jgi:hypothetical protein